MCLAKPLSRNVWAGAFLFTMLFKVLEKMLNLYSNLLFFMSEGKECLLLKWMKMEEIQAKLYVQL